MINVYNKLIKSSLSDSFIFRLHFGARFLSLLNPFIFLMLMFVPFHLRVISSSMVGINLSLLSLTLLLNGIKSAGLFSMLITSMMMAMFVVPMLFLLIFRRWQFFLNIIGIIRILIILFYGPFETNRLLLHVFRSTTWRCIENHNFLIILSWRALISFSLIIFRIKVFLRSFLDGCSLFRNLTCMCFFRRVKAIHFWNWSLNSIYTFLLSSFS